MEDANASEADYGSTADTMEQASDVESEAGSESSKKRRVASGLPKEFYPRDLESAERPWFDLTDPEAKWYKARYAIDLSPNNEEYANFAMKYGDPEVRGYNKFRNGNVAWFSFIKGMRSWMTSRRA